MGLGSSPWARLEYIHHLAPSTHPHLHSLSHSSLCSPSVCTQKSLLLQYHFVLHTNTHLEAISYVTHTCVEVLYAVHSLFFLSLFSFLVISIPNMGLELTTVRSNFLCSSD